MQDFSGTVHTVEFIADDGTKSYLFGGRKKACFFVAASVPGGPILICEGYATGASLAQATGWTVLCAMDCGNILPVSQAVRLKYPTRTIIIAADNDQFTDGNPGLTKAEAAANTIRGLLASPEFSDTLLKQQPTDFNDLHQLQGLQAVKTQMSCYCSTRHKLARTETVARRPAPRAGIQLRLSAGHVALVDRGHH